MSVVSKALEAQENFWLRMGVRPTRVYLGEAELDELSKCRVDLTGNDGITMLFGMQVVKANTPSACTVSDEQPLRWSFL